MKNRMRFKAAMDLCIQEKAKFRLSVLEIIIFMCVSIQVLFMVFQTYGYRERVQEGFKVPVSQVGYCVIVGSDSDTIEKIRNLPEILHYGTIDTGVLSTAEELRFLREVQRGHQKFMSDSDYDAENGVEVMVVSPDLWEVMNLKLVEGMEPWKAEPPKPADITSGYLIYLSEAYRDVVNVGDVFESRETTSKGELLLWYIIAGFIDKNSTVTDPYVFSVDNVEKIGHYSVDYEIIEVPVDGFDYDGFFVYSEESEFAEVERKIKGIAAENGLNTGDVYVYNLSSVVQYAEDDVKKQTAHLREAAVILMAILVLSVSGIQAFDVLTKTKDYGVWLSSGADKRDLVFFIIYQNVIRTAIALFISIPFMLLALHKLYGYNSETHHMINRIFIRGIIPGSVALGILTALMASVLPSCLIAGSSAINLIKGKIFE